jgi:hypothetical protein
MKASQIDWTKIFALVTICYLMLWAAFSMIVQMDTEMNALEASAPIAWSHRPTTRLGRRLRMAVEKQDSKAMSDRPPSQTTVRVSCDVPLHRRQN